MGWDPTSIGNRNTFIRQQPAFCWQAARESAEAAIRGKDTVARDHNWDGIRSDRAANSLRTFGSPHGSAELAIGSARPDGQTM